MRYPKMCRTVHSTHKKIMQVNHYVFFIIERKDKLAYLLLSGIFALLALPSTVIIRILASLFRLAFGGGKKLVRTADKKFI